jgi:hypothetical protein
MSLRLRWLLLSLPCSRATPNFDAYPLTQQILQDEKTPPNSRIDLLLGQVTEQDCEAIKGTCDPSAWQLAPNQANGRRRNKDS